jgi:hypothetical protein
VTKYQKGRMIDVSIFEPNKKHAFIFIDALARRNSHI